MDNPLFMVIGAITLSHQISPFCATGQQTTSDSNILEGQVRKSGVICPSLILTLAHSGLIMEQYEFPLHPLNSKDRSLYWQKSTHLDGQISLNSMTHPCLFSDIHGNDLPCNSGTTEENNSEQTQV